MRSKSNPFVATASVVLLFGALAIAPNGVSAACNLEHFVTFEDADCSVLRSFDNHTFINEADETCTLASNTHGEAFTTTCNDTGALL